MPDERPPRTGPRRVDRRLFQSSVRDQGTRPTCLAFAATGGHEGLRGDGGVLSVEYLHWVSCQLDGASKEGVSLETTLKALLEIGQPHEELWPYSLQRDDLADDYGPPYDIQPDECHKVGWAEKIRPSIETVRRYLSLGKAVLIGVRLYKGFHYTGTGEIPLPEPGEAHCGRHAVLLVGYDDDLQVLLFKNSWGASWGDGGYGVMPYSYFREHSIIACVISDKDPGSRCV